MATTQADTPPMAVGVARVDITPDYPVRRTGSVVRQVKSEGVEQRLDARALALGDETDGGPSVLLGVETCAVSAALTEQVAQRLAAKTGLPRERLVLCLTHTHTAPALSQQALRGVARTTSA